MASPKTIVAYFTIAVFFVFLAAWAIIGSCRDALAVTFLFIAVDFMTPWPDIDKIIIVPYVFAPMAISLGLAKSKKQAIAVGLVISFLIGLGFLFLAILIIGDGALTQFKEIWTILFRHAFTTPIGLLFTIIMGVLMFLVIRAYYTDGE